MSSSSPIRIYFRNLKDILLSPAHFFATLPPAPGFGNALAFALITHWVGTGFHFFLSSLGGLLAFRLHRSPHIDTWFDSTMRSNETLAPHIRDLGSWLSGPGMILLDPFKTSFTLLVVGSVVYIACRIFITPTRTFSTSMRVLCYAQAASILNVIPGVGGMAAALYSFVLTIIGIREVFRTTQGTAVLVALSPFISIVFFLGAGFLTLALVFIQLFASIF